MKYVAKKVQLIPAERAKSKFKKDQMEVRNLIMKAPEWEAERGIVDCVHWRTNVSIACELGMF